MSCWVVPAVAAELWGLPVEQVLDLIRLGQVPSKQEYHFVLVDVAPHSSNAGPPQYRSEARPPTYTAISRQDPCSDDEPAADECAGPFDWKQARSGVTRRAPVSASHT